MVEVTRESKVAVLVSLAERPAAHRLGFQQRAQLNNSQTSIQRSGVHSTALRTWDAEADAAKVLDYTCAAVRRSRSFSCKISNMLQLECC